jgi:hypothetical protein
MSPDTQTTPYDRAPAVVAGLAERVEREMSDADEIGKPPPDALALLKDPRLEGLEYRGPRRSKAGAVLKPSDPPNVGDSPYVLFRVDYEEASTAKVTWTNEPPGLTSLLEMGSGKGFARLTETPHFEEERPRPAAPREAWVYTGWLIASPRFAEIVRQHAGDSIATVPVDWVFADGKKLDGYVFLDVLPLIHAYDYQRSQVAVRIGERGPYISSLGYPRALRRGLRADLPIFRDAFRRNDIFVSRDLARVLLAAKLRGFDFEDPARQGSTDP